MSEDIKNEYETQNEETSHSSTETRKENKIIKPFYFLIFGIGSLLAWNVIISDMDFFDYFFKSNNLPSPTVIFPFLNFALNITFQFIIVYSTKKFSYHCQLITTLSLLMLTMILLPLVVLLCNEYLGYYLSCTIIFLQGLVSAICTSSFFGLVSYFKMRYIVMLSTGQGVSGILMNVIKYILLITVPRPREGDADYDDKEKSAYILEGIIYFSTAFVILLICLICVVVSYRNRDFIKDLKYTDEYDIINNNNKHSSLDMQVDVMKQQPLLKDNDVLPDNNIKQNVENSETYSFCSLIKTLIEVNLLVMFSYIITFTVFPSAIFKPSLFNLSPGWKFNTITTLFNVFDTIGRKIISSFQPNKPLLYWLTIIRFSIIILIPLNYYLEIVNGVSVNWSIFLIVNAIFLGITNGLCTSLSYALAPTLVKGNLKGKSGSSVSFFNILGIFIGTCVAFGMNELINIISTVH